MSPLYRWICFIFCLGLTAGGVLVLFRRPAYRQYPALRYLQYYLILMYTFGFYALWSQLVLRSLFFSVIKAEQLGSLSRFLVLLSVPFLLVGKLMLVLWVVRLPKHQVRSHLVPAILTLLVLALLLYARHPRSWTLYQVYAAFVTVLMTGVGTWMLFIQTTYLHRKSQCILGGLILSVGAVHGSLWLGVPMTGALELLFILLYFLSHTAFVTYFLYQVHLPEVVVEVQAGGLTLAIAHSEAAALDLFVEAYNLTPREAEIVREIYRGKTNKEIAEILFVTVQTIKDHTHRIYQKTDVKSRTQLASLLRAFQK